jgi:hypothetical protein
MARTQKMASPFLTNVVLEAPDPFGAAVAVALTDAELLSKPFGDVVATAFVPSVDVEVAPGTVTTEAMIESGVEVALTADDIAVVTNVGVTLGVDKGAVSDKIAVGTMLDVPVLASVECRNWLRAAEAVAETAPGFAYVMKPIEVCMTFPLVKTEATGNSMGNGAVGAPGPSSVRDTVGGMKM